MEGYVFTLVCPFVCLSLRKTCQKFMNGFQRHFRKKGKRVSWDRTWLVRSRGKLSFGYLFVRSHGIIKSLQWNYRKKMWLEINKQKNNWNRYGSRGGSMFFFCHFVYMITQNVMTFNVMLGKGLSCSNGQFVRLNGGSGADSRVFAWSSVCVNAKHLKMWPCE